LRDGDPSATVTSLSAELERARDLETDTLADAIERIGF